LDLFVSMDLYVTETNRYADYILPGTTFLEREDLPLVAFPHSIRPYAQYTDAVIPAVGEARDDHDILNDLAARLHSTLVGSRAAGYMHAAPPGFNPIETIDRLLTAAQPRNLTNPDLSVEKLKALPHGVMLAEVLSCDNSTSKIIHKDGLIHLWSDLLEPEFDRMSLEAPPDIDELRLFGRRTIRSINSWMHNVDRLVRGEKPSLLMHPDDAAKRGIADGEQVIVRSRSGQIEVTACLSADVMPGSICYPHGWGHGGGWRRANEKAAVNVNILADPLAAETISGSAFLDGIPVTVVGVAPKFDNDGRSALRRRSLTI
jgi:formate dehydrogenase